MRILFTILTVAAFLGSCIWAYKVRDYEPYIAVAASAAALVGLWVTGDADKPNIKMSQKGGKKSKLYQSAGNMTFKSNPKQDER
jgi:hypothetical protein